MACCSPTAQKFWLAGCTTTTLLIALLLGLTWPMLSLRLLLYPELVLREGSLNYENWKESPIPIYFEISMFNWTNADQVHNHSVKPHFAEMGPYVFEEKHIRTNVTWHPNNTVSFYQKRIWHFVPEMSNGSLDDNVTNLNTIAATVAYSSRFFDLGTKLSLGFLMSQGRAPIYITKSVRELLFDGYDDILLDLVNDINNPNFPKPPFKKFGWFVERNGSETYDGKFTMFTGSDDISKLGMLQLWNDLPTTNLYRGQCDQIQGTTGELWPPIQEGAKPPRSVFATDVCRAVTVKYESEYSKYGINGYKWVGDDSVFDNGIKYPEMACYCTADEAFCPDLLPGIFNASACKFGAPAFISYPHFYLAHDHYKNAIEGMHPNKENHEFRIAMEPRTGIPISIRAQLQINLLMKSYWWTSMKNVPEIVIPMMWFKQSAELTEELAAEAKIAMILPRIGVWVAWGLAGVAGVLVLLGGFCFMYRWREIGDDEELLT